ncbi:uncharacterized protein si:dkey-22i16.9 [Micropterus dolomieu]|uniref:uncharacterized protein si:dkey-22i16.9 n=1 Tax=Micropterus dolomieu TaxID=147949 RepID=UPI001E8D9D48|nr:uncharacterized protein si:dkey-22i16.9 [Micropterus dolomieu]
MALAWMLSVLAIVFFLFGTCVKGKLVSANPEKSANLTAIEKCTDGEEFRLMTHDMTLTVASLVGGVWTPESGYNGRIKHHSELSVILTPVNYNDNGLYEFTCGSRVVTVIELEVITTCDVSVTEGDTVTLPCHSFTAGGSAKVIRWEKDGELVIELDPSSEEIRYAAKFERRVSVSPDWHLKGDTSLTFERVESDDQGDFVCHAQDKDGKRKPVAVRMRVKKCNLDQTTSKPPPLSLTQNKMGDWSIAILAVVCLIVGILLDAGFRWLLNYCRSNRPAKDVEMDPRPVGLLNAKS